MPRWLTWALLGLPKLPTLDCLSYPACIRTMTVSSFVQNLFVGSDNDKRSKQQQKN